MRKGTVIHLDNGESLPHQELAMADLVIRENTLIKYRYGPNGSQILYPCQGGSGPLDRGIFRDWQVAKDFADTFEERINDRIDEILKIIHEAFGEGTGGFNWYFDDADEDEMGTIYIPQGDEDEISYVYENHNDNKRGFLENSEWNYTQGIPKKFLFMKNDEISEYIAKQIERCAKKDAQKKAKAEIAKKEKDKKKQEVLKKLSPEEKKLLGL